MISRTLFALQSPTNARNLVFTSPTNSMSWYFATEWRKQKVSRPCKLRLTAWMTLQKLAHKSYLKLFTTHPPATGIATMAPTDHLLLRAVVHAHGAQLPKFTV
jgi:hypothetical protein